MPNVVVACKLPAGLVMEIVDPVNPTGEIGSQPPPVGRRVTLNGANFVQRRVGQKNALGQYPMLKVYPYGLTVVDQSFWEAMAKERVVSVSTGLEPLTPDGKSGDKRLSTEADPEMKKLMVEQEQETPAAA